MKQENSNYRKAQWFYSLAEFWSGSSKMFDKLAGRAYKNNNIGLYDKFNGAFWFCNKRAMNCNSQAKCHLDETV